MVQGPTAVLLIVRALSSSDLPWAVIANDYSQTTEWVFLGIALLMIFARLHLQLNINHQRLFASDYFKILAWLASVSNASFDIVFLRLRILKPEMDVTLNLVENLDVLQRVLRVRTATVRLVFGIEGSTDKWD